jgi:hypothetical protein
MRESCNTERRGRKLHAIKMHQQYEDADEHLPAHREELMAWAVRISRMSINVSALILQELLFKSPVQNRRRTCL